MKRFHNILEATFCAFLLLTSIGHLVVLGQNEPPDNFWDVQSLSSEGQEMMEVQFSGLLLSEDGRGVETVEQLTAVSNTPRTLILTPTFVTDTSPYLITLLVDDSGSMRQHLIETKSLLREFVNWQEDGSPTDKFPNLQVSLLTFSEMIAAEGSQTFSDERLILNRTIAALEPDIQNPTCLFDAFSIAINSLRSVSPNGHRRALIVLTDGQDEETIGGIQCSTSPSGTIEEAKASEVPYYFVQFPYLGTKCLSDDWIVQARRTEELLEGMIFGCKIGGVNREVTTAVFTQIHRSFTQQFQATIPLHTYAQAGTIDVTLNGRYNHSLNFEAQFDHLPPSTDEEISFENVRYVEEGVTVKVENGPEREEAGQFIFDVRLTPALPREYDTVTVSLWNDFTGQLVEKVDIPQNGLDEIKFPATLNPQGEYTMRVELPQGKTAENTLPTRSFEFTYNPQLTIIPPSPFKRMRSYLMDVPSIEAKMEFDTSGPLTLIRSIFQPKVAVSSLSFRREDGNVNANSPMPVTLQTGTVESAMVDSRLTCNEQTQPEIYPIPLGTIQSGKSVAFTAPSGWANCTLALIVTDVADGLTKVQMTDEIPVVVPEEGWGARIIWLRGLMAARWVWLTAVLLFLLLLAFAYLAIRLSQRLQDNTIIPGNSTASRPQALRFVVESAPDELIRGQEKTVPAQSDKPYIIGTEGSSNLVLNEDESIKKQHAIIRYDANLKRFTLTDSQSASGTYINDQRLVPQERVPLPKADGEETVRIKIGRRVQLRVIPTPEEVG